MPNTFDTTKGRGVRKGVFVLAALLVLLVGGCAGATRSLPATSLPAAASAPTATPAPPEQQARVLASEVASAVVAGDSAALFGLMEPAFRESTTYEAAKPSIDRILAYGGKPINAVFKQEESGSAASANGVRTTLTFWYLLETSGGKNGPYYLKVDVVQEGGTPVVSYFSVVNFPVNGPPESFK